MVRCLDAWVPLCLMPVHAKEPPTGQVPQRIENFENARHQLLLAGPSGNSVNSRACRTIQEQSCPARHAPSNRPHRTHSSSFSLQRRKLLLSHLSPVQRRSPESRRTQKERRRGKQEKKGYPFISTIASFRSVCPRVRPLPSSGICRGKRPLFR
jgi:hypothetical protein